MKQYRLLSALSIIILLQFITVCVIEIKAQTIPMSGEWRFALDPESKGDSEEWFSRTLEQKILLPGSCEQYGYGEKAESPAVGKLTRVVSYEGKAWYQKDFELPESYSGKRIELFIERCHWESSVWLDGNYIGMENTLSAPHLYDFGVLSPGKHRITVCVDNTNKIPIGSWAHAITEDTQGNWNGIIGKIEIRATPQVWISNVRAFENRLEVNVGNITGENQKVQILKNEFVIPAGGTKISVPFVIGGAEWDEFDPIMQEVDIVLQGVGISHLYKLSYANRKIEVKGKTVSVNGNTILFRGPVDECVYPITGYPPMDKDAWLRVFTICKDHGFNYMRYHSWCPPEAAFEAADEIGIYLQVELPFWSMDVAHYGEDAERDAYLKRELYKILDTYGNHPSFALMAMGNESSGPLYQLVCEARDYDPRHIYRAENGVTSKYGDFVETGLRGVAGPTTDWDRTTTGGWIAGTNSIATDGEPIPVLGHEIGQWEMYPDFSEIDKYTGTLRACNYERYRQSLAESGMLGQNKDFARASGLFSVLLYKEDIEAGMRTFPYAGFQILEARDYPGQGTAVVGWLDAFWDSKGLITPEEFKSFSGSSVLLMRMKDRVYSSGDIFEAKAQIAHYGKEDIFIEPEWKLVDEEGNVTAKGVLPETLVKAGGLTDLGTLSIPLKALVPGKFTLEFSGSGLKNEWNIWIFPEQEVQLPENVYISYRYDSKTKKVLENGGRVLLFANPATGIFPVEPSFLGPDKVRNFKVTRKHCAVEGSFMPAFWNMRLFNQTGTLGLLCMDEHPALAGFPTEEHTDWQWADLLGRFTAAQSFRTAGASADYCDALERIWGDVRNRSKAIVLNDAPEGFRPIVQAIDNFERNYRLGVVFETKVGKGRLLVCAMDLDTDAENRPAAKCMKQSLLDYVAGEDFNPEFELNRKMLNTVLKASQKTVRGR